MDRKIQRKLISIFESYPQIKLVYLFGSQASGKTGPLSDYDFAFWADERDRKKLFELKIDLMGKISRVLKTDNVDVVSLNTAESPELKYAVIAEGKLLLDVEPYRVLVEPRILNEFFDFRTSLKINIPHKF